jgi:hypothetical protein
MSTGSRANLQTQGVLLSVEKICYDRPNDRRTCQCVSKFFDTKIVTTLNCSTMTTEANFSKRLVDSYQGRLTSSQCTHLFEKFTILSLDFDTHTHTITAVLTAKNLYCMSDATFSKVRVSQRYSDSFLTVDQS